MKIKHYIFKTSGFLCIINLFLITATLFSCANSSNGYTITITDGRIDITMKSPTIGIVGINQVGFDGFTPRDIDREVFNKIRKRSYSGDYSVYVTLKFKDSYGNYYNSSEKVNICILNGADVKKYADFSYFRGLPIHKSYPWIYNYK